MQWHCAQRVCHACYRKGDKGEKQRASVQDSIPEDWMNSGLLSLVIKNETRGGERIRREIIIVSK